MKKEVEAIKQTKQVIESMLDIFDEGLLSLVGGCVQRYKRQVERHYKKNKTEVFKNGKKYNS